MTYTSPPYKTELKCASVKKELNLSCVVPCWYSRVSISARHGISMTLPILELYWGHHYPCLRVSARPGAESLLHSVGNGSCPGSRAACTDNSQTQFGALLWIYTLQCTHRNEFLSMLGTMGNKRRLWGGTQRRVQLYDEAASTAMLV